MTNLVPLGTKWPSIAEFNSSRKENLGKQNKIFRVTLDPSRSLRGSCYVYLGLHHYLTVSILYTEMEHDSLLWVSNLLCLLLGYVCTSPELV